MAGISASGVSVGPAAPSAEEQELLAIYQGGENFLVRMKALSDAKKTHQEALEALGRGKATQAALDRANAADRDAAGARAEAAAVAERARADAALLLRNATAEVENIRAQALALAKDMEAKSVAMKADADAYAKSRQREADEAYLRAREAETIAERAMEAAKAMQVEALDLQSKLEERAKKLRARAARLTTQQNALKAALDDAGSDE